MTAAVRPQSIPYKTQVNRDCAPQSEGPANDWPMRHGTSSVESAAATATDRVHPPKGNLADPTPFDRVKCACVAHLDASSRVRHFICRVDDARSEPGRSRNEDVPATTVPKRKVGTGRVPLLGPTCSARTKVAATFLPSFKRASRHIHCVHGAPATLALRAVRARFISCCAVADHAKNSRRQLTPPAARLGPTCPTVAAWESRPRRHQSI